MVALLRSGKIKIWIWVTAVALIFSLVAKLDAVAALPQIPLYGLFEISIINTNSYSNPFSDVELKAVFTSPSGRSISFFGFYDGDGNGGQIGNVWKQRFMPDEIGTWTYGLTFTDSTPGSSGSFECVADGAKPGPWRLDTDNPHWFKTARGEHFLPVAMHANAHYTPKDWQDAINWCKAKGYNTLVTATFNTSNWGNGWENVTAFGTLRGEPDKEVDYSRMNLRMWKEWDNMIQTAGDNGIYIGPFQGPSGKYGGQYSGKYPPSELAFFPGMRDRFNTSRNMNIIHYFVARQGAFWNLAYWSLANTEVYLIMDKNEFLDYGKYLASITPWGRMITGQDCEQWHDINRRWLSELDIPSSRKLNTVQSAVSSPDYPNWGRSSIENTAWQNASVNNEFALDSYGGFPVFGTEVLWEGQGRANKPLRTIWGFFTAGAHNMWADWRYDDGIDGGGYGSIGRGWIPLKPLTERLFTTDLLGVDTVGDEQLVIATEAMRQLQYWRMNPHNELVAESTEAYCLAEPGDQYMIYTPNGGIVKLDLTGQGGTFEAKWLNPRDGSYLNLKDMQGNIVQTTYAPTNQDWVLFLRKTHDAQIPDAPTNLRITDAN